MESITIDLPQADDTHLDIDLSAEDTVLENETAAQLSERFRRETEAGVAELAASPQPPFEAYMHLLADLYLASGE